jgi:hypothetical protein
VGNWDFSGYFIWKIMLAGFIVGAIFYAANAYIHYLNTGENTFELWEMFYIAGLSAIGAGTLASITAVGTTALIGRYLIAACFGIQGYMVINTPEEQTAFGYFIAGSTHAIAHGFGNASSDNPTSSELINEVISDVGEGIVKESVGSMLKHAREEAINNIPTNPQINPDEWAIGVNGFFDKLERKIFSDITRPY